MVAILLKNFSLNNIKSFFIFLTKKNPKNERKQKITRLSSHTLLSTDYRYLLISCLRQKMSLTFYQPKFCIKTNSKRRKRELN